MRYPKECSKGGHPDKIGTARHLLKSNKRKRSDLITLRSYYPTDAEALLRLFYDTVHLINRAHYAPAQLDAWIPSPDYNVEYWRERFAKEQTLVALFNDRIAGFGNLTGYGKSIGMLYVHKDYQRRGVASAILTSLECSLKIAAVKVSTVEASITARPFFEKQGYHWVGDNLKMVRGVELLNFIMEKSL